MAFTAEHHSKEAGGNPSSLPREQDLDAISIRTGSQTRSVTYGATDQDDFLSTARQPHGSFGDSIPVSRDQITGDSIVTYQGMDVPVRELADLGVVELTPEGKLAAITEGAQEESQQVTHDHAVTDNTPVLDPTVSSTLNDLSSADGELMADIAFLAADQIVAGEDVQINESTVAEALGWNPMAVGGGHRCGYRQLFSTGS